MRGNFTSRRIGVVGAAMFVLARSRLPALSTRTFWHRRLGVRAVGLLLVLGCAAVADSQFRAAAQVSPLVWILLKDPTDCWAYEGGIPRPGPYWAHFIDDINRPSALEPEATTDPRDVDHSTITIKGAKRRVVTIHRVPCPPPPLRAAAQRVKLNPSLWQGFYIGGFVTGNFNTLGQTETFKATDDVTNRFSDSSNAVGGGFNAGFLFSPFDNNILIGPSASVDFLRQDTNHTFPPGPFFLGQTINTITTVGGQVGFVPRPDVLVYGQVGAAFVNVTQKLNFLGPVTSVDQTVTGVNVGIGAAFQPHWEFAGHPVAVFAQYNRVFVPVATFNNPGSPGFTYDNRNDINTFTAGIRVRFVPDAERAEDAIKRIVRAGFFD
jgi:opacity protein-like surface antigen